MLRYVLFCQKLYLLKAKVPKNGEKILFLLVLGNEMEMKKFPSSKNLEVSISADIYLFKITNQNTRKRCEICSKLTIKAPEQLHWLRSGVFIVLTWNTFETVFYCFYCWLWTYIYLLGKAPTHSTNQRALLYHLCFSPTMTRAIIDTSSFEV